MKKSSLKSNSHMKYDSTVCSPFVANLYALRKTVIMCLAGFALCIVALVPFTSDLFEVSSRPLLSALPTGSKMLSVGVISPVLGPLKVLLFCAFVLSLPFTLYQIWKFVAPALYSHEKKTAVPFVLSAVFMFLAGTFYCYFVVFGALFPFIASFAPLSVNFAPDIEAYISFLLHMFLAFGLAFETPVAVFVLVASSLVKLEQLKRIRRYVTVGAFALSAVLTPPDITSQLLLALPLLVLYEMGLLAASIFHYGKRKTLLPVRAS